VPAIWIVLLFLAAGLIFLRKTGLHYDASDELGCFYPCRFPVFRPKVFGQPLPLMVIQYLGAFKAWLYWPILTYLKTTVAVLRLPFLLVGAATVWLCFTILDRISGRRAAVAGALLLATDASYVITTTYDFGPVVFLHFFLLAGIALLLSFERNGRLLPLGLAFFLFGLALWHKALFVWMLGGLGIAGVLVLHDRIRSLLSVRRGVVAAGAFCLGALPLLYYNAVTGGATLHSETVMSGKAPMSQKLRILKRTLDGSVFFGWLTEEARPETSIQPASVAAKAAVRIADTIGRVRADLLVYAVVTSLLLLPWLWFTPSRTAAVFVAIYLVVAWGLMAVLPNTGATLHHVVLLWPFPHMLVAIAGAQLSYSLARYGRRLAFAALILLVGSNVILLNQYHADLATLGTTAIWTDAVNDLAAFVQSVNPTHLVTVDWGYSATLCLLSDGDRPRYDISFILLQPTDAQKKWVSRLIADPRNLFVDHAADAVAFPEARKHLASIALAAGYRRQTVIMIADRNHRPRFEIFRYVTAR
jgi:4-amino-4-deoxy-L-arabinose transferase-like glycosyltransferase